MLKLLATVGLTALVLSGCSSDEKLSDYLIPKKNTVNAINAADNVLLETYKKNAEGVLYREYSIIFPEHSIRETSQILEISGSNVLIKDVGAESTEERTYPNKVAADLTLFSNDALNVYISKASRELTVDDKKEECIDITEIFKPLKISTISVYCKGKGKIGRASIVGDTRSSLNIASTSVGYPEDDFDGIISSWMRVGTNRWFLSTTKGLADAERPQLAQMLLGLQIKISEEAHKPVGSGFHTLEAEKLAIYGMQEPLSEISSASLATCIMSLAANDKFSVDSLAAYVVAKANNSPFGGASGQRLSALIAECLKKIPGVPKNSKSNANGAVLPENAPVQGVVAFTLEGKDYTYKLMKLNPQDAAKAFALMATSPVNTTQHPLNDNPIFREAKILEEKDSSGVMNTTLIIAGNKIFTTSQENEKHPYEMQSLSSLGTQPELLLISTYAGGNSCASQQQLLFARSGNGYLATDTFGRCQLSWFDDHAHGITYFVYPANESTPLEVIALTREAKQ